MDIIHRGLELRIFKHNGCSLHGLDMVHRGLEHTKQINRFRAIVWLDILHRGLKRRFGELSKRRIFMFRYGT